MEGGGDTQSSPSRRVPTAMNVIGHWSLDIRHSSFGIEQPASQFKKASSHYDSFSAVIRSKTAFLPSPKNM